jgi:glycosyltransferase involved in cell wall biosynthesis
MNSPLRILQANSLFQGGGTDNQTIDLCFGLRALGEEVTLAVPEGCRLLPLVQECGLRIETFPPKSWLKLAMIRRLIQIIRAWHPHVLHVHQGRDYWPAVLAARLACGGTRVVVTRHLMTRPRAVSRWLLLSFADVVAVSKVVLEVQQRELHGPVSRLHQIYGGIDTAKFQPVRSEAALAFRGAQGWEEKHVVFGVVGACDLPRGKGQLEFVEAAAQLRSEFPDARYAIVGDGSMKPLLRERVAALGADDVVHFVPFTNDIVTVLGALDLLAHPAVGTEALGLVLWEALACGKPVIASRLHGIPEAFREGEHGFLIPPGNASSLAGAMKNLLKDPELRRRFGAAGREWVCQNFSREAYARRMRELYLQLLPQA